MLEGILSDIDNVIVDSEKVFCKGVILAFAEYDVPVTEQEFVHYWMIERTKSAGLIKDRGLDISLEELRKVRQGMFDRLVRDELELMPYAKEMVESLSGIYPMAAVSSDNMQNCLLKIGKFGLVERFQTIVSHECTVNQKPSPDPYLEGARRLGLKAENCAVIEDNPTGALSGLRAGCKVVVYPNGYTANMDFPEGVVRVNSLKEVTPEMLKKLNHY